MNNTTKCKKRNKPPIPRKGSKDIWNSYMAKDAKYTSFDIPCCPTTCTKLPTNIITWEEAYEIHKRNIQKKHYKYHEPSFICFYIDDYKFDGPNGIWRKPKHALKIIRHFDGVITPDFSTYQDFPEAIKIYATYRMRLFGYWLGKNGIQVINNVRWGTIESYRYCFNGISRNSIVAIGTVGGSPKKLIDRKRFTEGLEEMIRVLHPHTIIVYGSSNYPCFKKLRNRGIKILTFPSKTSTVFKEIKNEQRV